MKKLLSCRSICIGLAIMGLSTAATAQSLGAGLGQTWPNAQDVSISTHWHVYVFGNNGIRYVQVNDAYGNVRVAFGAANGQFLVLPMGRDAQRISTPQQPAASGGTAVPLTSYSETIYRDDAITLDAVPMSDGTTRFSASSSTTSTAVSPCDDPAECNGHLN